MRQAVLLGAIALTACGYGHGPMPNRAEIVRVERALSTTPCIRKTTNWGRTYQYHFEPNGIAPFLSSMDRDVIDFDLARGSKSGGSTVHLRPPYPPLRYNIRRSVDGARLIQSPLSRP